jgi:hypothetical protein
VFECAPTVADGFAAQSADTEYKTCTDYAPYVVETYTAVTTTDNIGIFDPDLDASQINTAYIMNPDPAAALWSNFITFNAIMYAGTGETQYLVNDSDHELSDSDLWFISAADGTQCDPTSGDPYCAVPQSSQGGRLVFKYTPTCVPVIEALEVQTEFVGFEEGECVHNGDITGNPDPPFGSDGFTNVLVFDHLLM